MKNSGFTLIEILVAISLGGVIITALLGVFFSFIEYQASSQDQRNALESVQFLLGDVSRELSFGRDYRCGALDGSDCTCITFLDQLNRRVKIRYTAATTNPTTKAVVDKSVKLLDSAPETCAAKVGATTDTNTWSPLTDDSVDITKLEFDIVGGTNEQPRVQIASEIQYMLDGATETVGLKTQVTQRAFEPSTATLNRFVIGVDTDDAIGQASFVWKNKVCTMTDSCTGEDGVEVTSGTQPVCMDQQGNEYSGADAQTPCFGAGALRPIAAEFTTDGLYVLAENGLVFFIKQDESVPQAGVNQALEAKAARPRVPSDTALTATTAGITEKLVPSSSITVTRVIGKEGTGTCRRCEHDPHSIISLHRENASILARGYNGSLYKVGAGADNDQATRFLSGGRTANRVRHINTDGTDRTFFLLGDSGGAQKLRLSKDGSGLQKAGITGNCATEFNFVVATTGCKQLSPDPDNSVPEIQPDIVKDQFPNAGTTPLSFIDSLQVINNTIHIWFSDNSGKHLISVGTGTQEAKRGAGTSGSLNTELVDTTRFAYGNGLERYTFACAGGKKLCAIPASTNPSTATSFGTDDKTDLPAPISSRQLEHHIHFQDNPIGVDNKGRLLYFTNTGTPTKAVHEIKVYNHAAGKGLCGALPYDSDDSGTEPDQQVRFTYISEKHPTSNIVALVGTVFDEELGEAVSEIFLLEPTERELTDTSAKPENAQDICGKRDPMTNKSQLHIERHHLPAPTNAPALDLVRLWGVKFQDTKPTS